MYGPEKAIKFWNVKVNDIVISKLSRQKNNSKYLIKPLVLILPKKSKYVSIFKKKNNKLMSFCIENDNLTRNYKSIWSKTEGLQIAELNVLPVSDDRYITDQIGTYGDKSYTNF